MTHTLRVTFHPFSNEGGIDLTKTLDDATFTDEGLVWNRRKYTAMGPIIRSICERVMELEGCEYGDEMKATPIVLVGYHVPDPPKWWATWRTRALRRLIQDLIYDYAQCGSYWDDQGTKGCPRAKRVNG